MWLHYAVHTRAAHLIFRDFSTAARSWVTLSRLFPRALGATLMPDHLHLILPAATRERDALLLPGALGAISKHARVRGLWQPPGEPREIPDPLHLRRTLRYLALNPCRDRLCRDPLEWPWSTYRDAMGAAARPWVTASRLARELREPKNTVTEFRVRFHAHVSGDPSVAILGTPAPRPAPAREIAWESIGQIAAASAAALRLPLAELSARRSRIRRLFVHLAYRQGWRKPGLVAPVARCTVRGVLKILDRPVPEGLDAAALCLGDARLRTGFALPPPSTPSSQNANSKADPPGRSPFEFAF